MLCHSALFLLISIVSGISVQAQFNSGSTGADGALSPTSNVTVTLPPNGVLNYTSITIPQNVVVRFTRNALNTPVTILVQGSVNISGQIAVGGDSSNGRLGGLGGPGGFRGGTGGTFLDSPTGTSGDGPGGGLAGSSAVLNGVGGGGGAGFFQNGNDGKALNGGTGGLGGPPYGTKTLLPLIGGSGGGGGGVNSNSQNIGGGGGGGGGAVVLASSSSIVFGIGTGGVPAGINAAGGNGFANGLAAIDGGGGSGGAIRVIANTISGSPCLDVTRGDGRLGEGASDAASGLVRVEAFNLSGLSVQCSSSVVTLGQPNPVSLANAPTLTIGSVGGVAASGNAVGLINAPPDIVVPTSVPNPVAVVVNGANLPSGTAIQVKLTPESGSPATVGGTLTGSTASSTATVNLTLPSSGVSVIRATVTLDVLIALGRPTFINGEKVDKVEIAATFGGHSELVYILRSGRRVREAEFLNSSR
jgi:hypothetical protein